MSNPTKPTTNLTREELYKKTLGKIRISQHTDSEYGYSSETLLKLANKHTDDLMKLFDTYSQAKEREARMDERIRYKQTLESAIETYPIDNDWCRGRRQGIQDCIDDQTEIISELAALKTKQEVAN